jgi:hypothetical protein
VGGGAGRSQRAIATCRHTRAADPHRRAVAGRQHDPSIRATTVQASCRHADPNDEARSQLGAAEAATADGDSGAGEALSQHPHVEAVAREAAIERD